MGDPVDEANEKECTWEAVPMGDWTLYRASCGVAKYAKDRNWLGTTCENCGGTVILEPKS